MAASHWITWAMLSAVFAALTAVFAKLGVQQVHSDVATWLRTAMVLVVLTLFVAITGTWRKAGPMPPATWGWLAASALATGASWVCYFRALQAGPVAQVGAVDKLSVALLAVFAVVFLHERLSAREWLGVGFVCVGVVLLAVKR